MTTQANAAVRALTEKEKQTLRLIVRGHDAKSVARSLDLSVHTINERLRDARRKMAVSSSREAARLLLEVEGDSAAVTPELLGDSEIGEDVNRLRIDQDAAPIGGARRPGRRYLIIGVCFMSLLLGLLALAALPQAGSAPPQTADAAQTAADAEVTDAARQWLVLGDQGRWDDAYRATGAAFRKLNTLQAWTRACQNVRVPLGAMLARDVVTVEDLPAPPSGYQVVKFRTRFANKAEAVETVSLDREDGQWRVVGVTVG